MYNATLRHMHVTIVAVEKQQVQAGLVLHVSQAYARAHARTHAHTHTHNKLEEELVLEVLLVKVM